MKQNMNSLRFIGSKEAVIEVVRRTGDALRYASEGLRNDFQVVLEAVRQNGSALEFASKELQGDKNAVFAATRQNGLSLQYASTELRNDKNVVLVAVKRNGDALQYTNKELQNDKIVVLEAVKQSGIAIKFASVELRNDKAVVIEAVKEEGDILQYASEERRNDKEVVLEAVKHFTRNFVFASEELKNDKEFLLEALTINGRLLEYAGDALKNDKDVVFEAVKKNKRALQFASKEVVVEAVKRDGIYLRYASKKFRRDKDVVMEAVKQNGSSLQYASSNLQKNREFVLELVRQNGEVFQYVREKHRRDKDVVVEAVKKDGLCLRYASNKLKNDREVVFEAVKKNTITLQFASKKLQGDRDFILEVVKQNGEALRHVNEKFRDDKEIVTEAVKVSGYILETASEKLRNDREVVIEAVKQNGDALRFASDVLRNVKEVVLEAVWQNGNSLRFAGEKLMKYNNEVVNEAMKTNPAAFQYAGKYVVYHFVKKNFTYLQHASLEFKDDEVLVFEAVKQNGNALQYASSRVRGIKPLVLIAVKNAPESLQFVSETLQNDPHLQTFRDFSVCIISEEEGTDTERFEKTVKKNPIFLQFIDKDFLPTKEGLKFCFDTLSKSEQFLIHRFSFNFVCKLLDLNQDLFFKFMNSDDRDRMYEIVCKKPSLITKVKDYDDYKEFIRKVLAENEKVLEFIDVELFRDLNFVSNLPKPNERISTFFETESKKLQEKGDWKKALFFTLLSSEFHPEKRSIFDNFNIYLSEIVTVKLVGFLKNDSFSLEELSSLEENIRISFVSEVRKIYGEIFSGSECKKLFDLKHLQVELREYLTDFIYRLEDEEGKSIFLGVCRISTNQKIGLLGFGVEFVKKRKNNYFKVFEGMFFNNIRNGKGIEYQIIKGRSEMSFEGTFKNGNRHGRGESFDPLKGDNVVGKWFNGVLDPDSIFAFSCPLVPYQDVEKQLRDSSFIAKGGNGMVYKVKCSKVPFLKKMRKTIGEFAAVKIMKFKSGSNYNLKMAYRMIRRGISYCYRVNSPYILESYCIIKGKNEVGYIMRLCDQSIDDMIGKGNIPLEEKIRILHCTALGMYALHSKLLIHRDLKWGNVLMDQNRVIKLCDFDTVKEDEVVWRLRSMAQSSGVGTAGFRPPEVIQDKKFTMKSDVYAFGLMIYSLLWEEMSPYSTQYECTCGAKLEELLKTDDFSVFEGHILRCGFRPLLAPNEVRKYNPLLIDLMRECWDSNPFVRPSFEEIVKRLELVKEEKPFAKITLKFPSHPGVTDQVMYMEKPYQREKLVKWIEKKFEPPQEEEEEEEEEDEIKSQVLFLEHPRYGTIHEDNDLLRFIRGENSPSINVTLNHVNEAYVINRIKRRVDVEEYEKMEEKCSKLEKRVLFLRKSNIRYMKKVRAFLEKKNLWNEFRVEEVSVLHKNESLKEEEEEEVEGEEL